MGIIQSRRNYDKGSDVGRCGANSAGKRIENGHEEEDRLQG